MLKHFASYARRCTRAGRVPNPKTIARSVQSVDDADDDADDDCPEIVIGQLTPPRAARAPHTAHFISINPKMGAVFVACRPSSCTAQRAVDLRLAACGSDFALYVCPARALRCASECAPPFVCRMTHRTSNTDEQARSSVWCVLVLRAHTHTPRRRRRRRQRSRSNRTSVHICWFNCECKCLACVRARV